MLVNFHLISISLLVSFFFFFFLLALGSQAELSLLLGIQGFPPLTFLVCHRVYSEDSFPLWKFGVPFLLRDFPPTSSAFLSRKAGRVTPDWHSSPDG